MRTFKRALTTCTPDIRWTERVVAPTVNPPVASALLWVGPQSDDTARKHFSSASSSPPFVRLDAVAAAAAAAVRVGSRDARVYTCTRVQYTMSYRITNLHDNVHEFDGCDKLHCKNNKTITSA